MKKTNKIIMTVVCVLLAVVLLAEVGIFLARSNRKPVAVYSIDEFYLSTTITQDMSSYGYVKTDRLQLVYLSQTQEVTGVLVQEGQYVEAGQPLLSYDTTLSELTLNRKKLDIEKSKMRITDAEAQLDQIKKLKPITYIPGSTGSGSGSTGSSNVGTLERDEDFRFLKYGRGTEAYPATLWAREDLVFDEDVMAQIFDSYEANSEAEALYIIVETRKNDSGRGEVTNRTGLLLLRDKILDFQPVETKPTEPEPTEPEPTEPEPTEPEPTEPEPTEPEPTEPEPTEPEPTEPEPTEPEPTEAPEPSAAVEPTEAPEPSAAAELTEATEPTATDAAPAERAPAFSRTLAKSGFTYVYSFTFFPVEEEENEALKPTTGPSLNMNSGYTSSQITQMREDMEAQLKEMRFNLKMAEAEYAIMQEEYETEAVCSDMDGYVVSVLDPQEALATGEPAIKISAGGGFIVEGSISEMFWSELRLGQQVEVTDWQTGAQYPGTITEIGEHPVDSGDYASMEGNPNVSYYPVSVSVDGTADLRTDGYYVNIVYENRESTSLYLDAAFVRQENGLSYVFVQDGQGLLEKRQILTGKTIYDGSYVEILAGLTEADYIAFPYGKDVKAGAETVLGTEDQLYAETY